MTLQFTIEGAPRTKKNSLRRLRVGKFLKSVPSKAYCDYAQAAQWQLKSQIQRAAIYPLTCQVNCQAMFYRHANVGDSDGFYAGLADILQGAGVIVNDRQIVSWDGSRLLKDSKRPRVEVTLTAAGAGEGK